MSENIDPIGNDGSNKVSKSFSGSEPFSDSRKTPSVLKTDGPGEDLSAVSGSPILLSLNQQTSDAGANIKTSSLLKIEEVEPPKAENEEQMNTPLDNTEMQLYVAELSNKIGPSTTNIFEMEEKISLDTISTDLDFGLNTIIGKSESILDTGILCCRYNCLKACHKREEKIDLKISESIFAVPSYIRVAPATRLWVSNVDDSVKIRMAESGPGSENPITIHQMFKCTVEKFHNRTAIAYKSEEHLHRISYSNYYEKCRKTAKGFLKLGLERYHGVGIVAANCPEWFFATIGAIMAGGLPTGIYMTSSVQMYQYFASKTNANILVVETYKLVEKILKVRNELPMLKAIVQIKFQKKTSDPDVYTWRQMIELGIDITDKQLDDIMESQHANQCCLITFTSGTTGYPKGIMMSHDNITWSAYATGINMDFGIQNIQERLVSYMPLCHIAIQMMDLWTQMAFGGLTYFSSPNESNLVDEMREVEPTIFEGVPHIWEKIQENLENVQTQLPPLKVFIQLWARKVGRIASNNHMKQKVSLPFGYNLANKLVFKKVHHQLGLAKCTRCFTGAAPISKNTMDTFHSFYIFILQIYGLSESTGAHTTSVSYQCDPGSCGKAMEGCKIRIDKMDENSEGEVCLWGRNIFMGYLNMMKQTELVIDSEGWLHSEDLGHLNNEGFLYLTGRIKELIILTNGMHIAPIPIENAVKEEIPIVSHAMLTTVNNDLVILLTLKCVFNKDNGSPSDALSHDTLAYFQRIQSKAITVTDVIEKKDPAIYNAIQNGIDIVNKKASSTIQNIKAFIILNKDFSIHGGELGPTLKPRRQVVQEMYKEQIHEIEIK